MGPKDWGPIPIGIAVVEAMTDLLNDSGRAKARSPVMIWPDGGGVQVKPTRTSSKAPSNEVTPVSMR